MVQAWQQYTSGRAGTAAAIVVCHGTAENGVDCIKAHKYTTYLYHGHGLGPETAVIGSREEGWHLNKGAQREDSSCSELGV